MNCRRVSKDQLAPLGALVAIAASIAGAGPATEARAQLSAQVAGSALQAPTTAQSVCPLIEDSARANALPVDFFTRLIWRESRFQRDVIGPLTRSGDHALGIAQFMPRTAAERRLIEPFNPAEALAKSGAFLADLRDEFGNLGLAAAAYNAGAQRVRDYLDRGRDLPQETRDYVLAITGRPVEAWAKAGTADAGANRPAAPQTKPANCRDTALMLARADNSAEAFQHHVPSWCRLLLHPNISTCGPVHARVYAAARLESMHEQVRPLR